MRLYLRARDIKQCQSLSLARRSRRAGQAFLPQRGYRNDDAEPAKLAERAPCARWRERARTRDGQELQYCRRQSRRTIFVGPHSKAGSAPVQFVLDGASVKATEVVTCADVELAASAWVWVLGLVVVHGNI